MPNFSIAAYRPQSQFVALNTIGNNLANLNTTAYKEQTTNFADLYYQTIGTTGGNVAEQVGTGTRVSSIDHQLYPGKHRHTTGTSTNMAINGNGYFVVQNDGEQQLTRDW